MQGSPNRFLRVTSVLISPPSRCNFFAPYRRFRICDVSTHLLSEIEENATCCLEKPDQTRPDGAECPLASEPGPPLRRTTRLWGSPATQVNCLDCPGRGGSGDWAYPEVALRSLRRPLGQDLLALGSRRGTLGSLGRTLRSQDRLALGSLKRTLGSRRRTRWSWGRIPEGRERLGLLLIHDHEATPEWWMADG